MTREEIEQKMDELARKYVETHDPEIPYEIYRLARELEKLNGSYRLTEKSLNIADIGMASVLKMR